MAIFGKKSAAKKSVAKDSPLDGTDGVRVGESPVPGLTLQHALTGSH